MLINNDKLNLIATNLGEINQWGKIFSTFLYLIYKKTSGNQIFSMEVASIQARWSLSTMTSYQIVDVVSFLTFIES